MGTAKTRIWFTPTSPRSPSKIRNELTLLSRFDNLNWWEADEDNNLIHQVEYAHLLSNSDFYEGEIPKNLAFAARDRLRAPQMLGFAYIDKKHTLHITPAGWQLIRGQGVETLFLKQMLKLQFPSWQHGGNPNTHWRYHYPLKEAGFFPFVETLRIVQAVDGITKDELAIFVLPVLSHAGSLKTTDIVLKFREEKSKIRAGRERSEFVDSMHERTYYSVYKDDIESGNINTRERPTYTVENFVRKKMRNSRDYADSCFRYFQYTGMFSRTDERLIISPTRQTQAQRILNEMTFSVITYDNVEYFYSKFGNPDLPVLPWENVTDLETEIADTRSNIETANEKLKAIIPTISLPVIKPKPSASVENLMQYSYELRTQLRATNQQVLSMDLGTPAGIQEIIDIYQRILDRDIVESPLFMEWNTWRAFLALDYFHSLKPNLELDDNLMPISVAGGRKPDMEIYYYEDYVVLVEVTLSSGERQYDTEAEPVTRHVARFQAKQRTEGGRKVFGLFIAPRINSNTVRFFHVHLTHDLIQEAGGKITIIPMALSEFIEFVRFCINNNAFTAASFRKLLDRIENLGTALDEGQAIQWREEIQIALCDWQTQHLKQGVR